MQVETKRILLLKELVRMIDQVKKCRDNLCLKGFSQYPNKENVYQKQAADFEKYLNKMQTKISSDLNRTISPGTGISKQDIAEFRKELATITFPYHNFDEATVYFGDQISKDQTCCEKMFAYFGYCIRTVLYGLDYLVAMGDKKSYSNQGETPFALRLTGRSQFFPSPITSMYNSLDRLKNINKRLEQTFDASLAI